MKHRETHPTDVEGCFGCKAAGFVGTTFGFEGRESFHNEPSVHQRERDHIRELRAKGIDFDRAS